MQPEPSGKVAKLPTSLRRSQGAACPPAAPPPAPADPPPPEPLTHGSPGALRSGAGAGPCSATSLLVLPPGPGSLGLVVTLPAPGGGPRPGEGGGRDGEGMGRRYSLAPRSPGGERSGRGRFGGRRLRPGAGSVGSGAGPDRARPPQARRDARLCCCGVERLRTAGRRWAGKAFRRLGWKGEGRLLGEEGAARSRAGAAGLSGAPHLELGLEPRGRALGLVSLQQPRAPFVPPRPACRAINIPAPRSGTETFLLPTASKPLGLQLGFKIFFFFSFFLNLRRNSRIPNSSL